MRWITTGFLSFITTASMGLVDAKSGNYKKTFSDFEFLNPTFSLSLDRTYNSRSLYTGLFGVGWCSNLETKVTALPDQTLKLTECGGGQEIIYVSKGVKPDINKQVQQILARVKKQNKRLSEAYFNTLRSKLLKSHVLRNEFLRAYNIRGQLISGKPYLAEGRVSDVIVYSKKGYLRRSLPSGIDQFYDKDTGHLIQLSDRAGNFIKLKWNNGKPVQMMDQTGRKIVFKYDTKNQISNISIGGRVLASYKIKDENLVWVQNKDGVYEHTYDDLHNLTSTSYPPATKGGKPSVEQLSYNKKKDWVTSFKNQQQCVETYTYQVNPNNPNHYWTDVKKECGKVVTNVSRYEFWNKKSKAGGLYLHRARQVVNGEVSDVTYHPQFRRVSNMTRNGTRTQYSYYKNGLLKQKSTKANVVQFSKYSGKCRKPVWLVLQIEKAINNQTNNKFLLSTMNLLA